MKYLILYIFLFLANGLTAQADSGLAVTFHLLFDNKPLVLTAHDEASVSSAIEIEALKLYVSKVELWDGNQLSFAEENSFHLLDAEDEESLTFHLDVPDTISFSRLRFNVGIDSLTNVSGAFGGDLDPTKGMYWAWQSGFINFKLEGKADNCPARHNRFQFHIGGYRHPFNALQTVELDLPDAASININLVLDEIFQQIDLTKTYQLMSPNEQSVAFSKLLPSLFRSN